VGKVADREFEVSGHFDYRPWPEIRHTAFVLRKLAREYQPGSKHTALAAVVLTAFSVEGFCQTLGPEVLNDIWLQTRKPAEAFGVLTKLKLIGSKCGIPVDYEKSPWLEIKQLFDARDKIAHPKPARLKVQGKVTAPGDADPRDLFYGVMSAEYEPLHNVEVLDRVAMMIDDALRSIWVAAGKDEAAFLIHGGGFWSATLG
jgi:hypothetical protein